MAEKEDKAAKSAKGSKAEKSDKAPRAEAGGKDGKGKQAQPGGKGQPQKGDKRPRVRKGEAGEKKPRAPQERVIPRLRTHFDEVVRKQLTEERGYKNKMEVPKLQKIVINMASRGRERPQEGRGRGGRSRLIAARKP